MILLQDMRLVSLQFSFSNAAVIPSGVGLAVRLSEKPFDRLARKLNPAGEQVIAPTQNVDSGGLLAEIEAAGFELVDAFYQKRGDRTYHTVRFVFAPARFATPSEEFRQLRGDALRAGLQRILTDAFWRVRAFSNPFYQKGKEVPGQRTLSINLEARLPRFHSDGSPVTARRKDANGKKIGDPQSLRPDHLLAVVGDTIQLIDPAVVRSGRFS